MSVASLYSKLPPPPKPASYHTELIQWALGAGLPGQFITEFVRKTTKKKTKTSQKNDIVDWMLPLTLSITFGICSFHLSFPQGFIESLLHLLGHTVNKTAEGPRLHRCVSEIQGQVCQKDSPGKTFIPRPSKVPVSAASQPPVPPAMSTL